MSAFHPKRTLEGALLNLVGSHRFGLGNRPRRSSLPRIAACVVSQVLCFRTASRGEVEECPEWLERAQMTGVLVRLH